MRAIQLTQFLGLRPRNVLMIPAPTGQEFGGPEALRAADIPAPQPEANQVLVRVVASSVNPVDWKRASGAHRLIMPVRLPSVPGFDIAGEVVQSGPGAERFPKGTRVHARMKESGACAELAVAGIDVVAKLPDAMPFDQGAGLPLAGMTALQGLRDVAGLPMQGATQRVLVVGASGGVGHIGVQVARAAGAYVVGVCSGRNAAMVNGLGANEVLDYTKPDPYAGQKPFDIVLDCVAGDPAPWLPLLAANGSYASTMPSGATFLRSALNVFGGKKVKPVMLSTNAPDLEFLDRLFEAGRLRVVIDSRYPLASLGEAWVRSMSGRTAGKIIVDVTAG